jgi:protein tyrosine/serine phosphatase
LDVALLSSFCTEMSALIPEPLLPVASMALLQELQALEQKGVHLSDQVYDVLRGQPFTSQEILDYIDAKTGEG